MNETFSKYEKLKSKKAIEQLFLNGRRIKKYPIQLLYAPNKKQKQIGIQAGFSVPKKRIKLAVHRNRIKRLLREAYRKNKYLFYKNLVTSHSFMFIYISNNEISYRQIEVIIKKLGAEFYKNTQREKNKDKNRN